MPSVKAASEGSNAMFVRGGSADQNLYLLNNISLYGSTHLFGLLSTFNSDIVDKATLLKGGFPASVGGRLSSVLDVRTKTGNLQHWQIRGALGILSSKLTIEAPIIKDKLSVVLAARRSYWDIFIKQNTNPEQVNKIPKYYFYDLNTKIYFKANHKNVFAIFAYTDQDKMYSNEIEGTNMVDNQLFWRNNLLGLSWEKFVNPNLSFSSNLNYSGYDMNVNTKKIESQSRSENDFTTSIQDLSVQSVVSYQNNNDLFKSGILLSRKTYNPSTIKYSIDSSFVKLSNFNTTTLYELSLFGEYTHSWSKSLKTNLGLRLNLYQTNEKKYFLPEPRLQFNYTANANVSFKGSYSRMNQSVHLLTNPGLGIPLDLWVPSTAKIRPQSADQFKLGTFYSPKLNKSLFFSVEGYYKCYIQVINATFWLNI